MNTDHQFQPVRIQGANGLSRFPKSRLATTQLSNGQVRNTKLAGLLLRLALRLVPKNHRNYDTITLNLLSAQYNLNRYHTK